MISPVSIDSPPAPVHGLEGQVFGKYRVLRRLGEGGMGTVYEAVHIDIGQRVALKVLHANVAAHPGYARRFLDEARAIGSVGHPGLVKVHDFSSANDGPAYIVMELLDGEPLSARLTSLRARGAQMPLGDQLRIIRQVASALTAVHQKGIIHRDLKPENIILVADPDTPGGERPKILDFGIAKLTDGSNSHQTTAGSAIGTPTYMSPEQCEGRSDVTARADCYALGVMFFEMLAGQPPFNSDSTAALLRQHIVRPPPPLPESVPPQISALVLQLLSKDPAERPTMAELFRRLDGSQTEVVKPSPVPRLAGRRSVYLLAGLAGLMLFLGLFVSLLLWRALRTPPATRSVTPPLTTVTTPPTDKVATPPENSGSKTIPESPSTGPLKPPVLRTPPHKKPSIKDSDRPLRIEPLQDKRRGHH